MEDEAGTGMYWGETKYSEPLEKYAKVFQAEVNAIEKIYSI